MIERIIGELDALRSQLAAVTYRQDNDNAQEAFDNITDAMQSLHVAKTLIEKGGV